MSATNVWAGGTDTIFHYNGTTWSMAATGGHMLAGSANDIWTNAGMHYDGTAWTQKQLGQLALRISGDSARGSLAVSTSMVLQHVP